MMLFILVVMAKAISQFKGTLINQKSTSYLFQPSQRLIIEKAYNTSHMKSPQTVQTIEKSSSQLLHYFNVSYLWLSPNYWFCQFRFGSRDAAEQNPHIPGSH